MLEAPDTILEVMFAPASPSVLFDQWRKLKKPHYSWASFRVDRYLDTAAVRGSSPLVPTNPSLRWNAKTMNALIDISLHD